MSPAKRQPLLPGLLPVYSHCSARMLCVCFRLCRSMSDRGEDGRSAFEYLLAHGARYNQQQLEEQAGLHTG